MPQSGGNVPHVLQAMGAAHRIVGADWAKLRDPLRIAVLQVKGLSVGRDKVLVTANIDDAAPQI